MLNSISRCMFRNMLVFLILVTISVSVTSYETNTRKALQSDAALYSSLGCFVFSFIFMFLCQIFNVNRKVKITSIILFGLSIIYFVSVGSSFSDPGSVMLALGVSIVLFTVLSFMSYENPMSKEGIRKWTTPLLSTLFILIIIIIINIFLHIEWLDFWLSIFIILLFSFLIVYDVSKFSYHCTGNDCCLDGTINLWLDFANIFMAMIGLR